MSEKNTFGGSLVIICEESNEKPRLQALAPWYKMLRMSIDVSLSHIHDYYSSRTATFSKIDQDSNT